ncbi:spermatogenesis-associated protein 17 isoform X2 [Cynoglossus semilaevis]|uniref:spermatogenesis-associated protein 17 isoform X2 n=1 Tax=Cynoglossus semilaevis TaxID=244447 RepID=UPI00049790B9|nr:spermatogenesis-associated protein 17 isoform X2 [Cynoglossus semilaevis]
MSKLLQRVSDGARNFRQEFPLRQKQADENRQTENQAAIRIQSWFRACKVQAYLRHLHQNAIIIQRLWRGFTARARFRQMVKIQQRWRGFYVRKYVHNFYARQRHLQVVSRKNKLIRAELSELEELQRRQRDCLEVIKQQTANAHRAHRLHHLLSTKHRPGVFNSPFRQAPHETELLLRQVKYQPPTRGRTGLVAIPDPTTPVSPESPRSSSPWPTLPPIVSRKQQVVFRQPGEVWQQCVDCPHLTCLPSSYSHLEEATRQLQLHRSVNLHGDKLLERNTVRQ